MIHNKITSTVTDIKTIPMYQLHFGEMGIIMGDVCNGKIVMCSPTGEDSRVFHTFEGTYINNNDATKMRVRLLQPGESVTITVVE